MDNNIECYSLDWDTEYFGFKSAKINMFNDINEKDKNDIHLFSKGFEFITIFNINNEKKNNEWIGNNTNAFLSDVNIQFNKQIKNVNDKINSDLIICNNLPANEEILGIALNTFTTSRFLNDSYLPIDKSQKMYYTWTKNAFNQSDKYFIVSRSKEKIDGFLLFSLKDNKCVIELIAVHTDTQGKNIGSNLINGLETYLYDNEYYTIQVGTQINNIAAIRFYTKMGFKYTDLTSTYHWWPNK